MIKIRGMPYDVFALRVEHGAVFRDISWSAQYERPRAASLLIDDEAAAESLLFGI